MSEQTGIDPVVCPWCLAHSGLRDANGRQWQYIWTYSVMYDHRVCLRCRKNEAGHQDPDVYSPSYRSFWVETLPAPIQIQTYSGLNYPLMADSVVNYSLVADMLKNASTRLPVILEPPKPKPRPKNAWERILLGDEDEDPGVG